MLMSLSSPRRARRGRRAPDLQRGLALGAGGTALVALTLGLLVAPTDAAQGPVQRLMYVHVPAAWAGFLAFAVVAVCSAAFLRTRGEHWDRRARAAAEIGVGSTGLCLVLGMIWGQQTWGTWWAWDPRLVTTALLVVVYAGVLVVRATGRGAAGAVPAAVLGVAGIVLVPVVHMSVVWWRTLHQPPTLLALHDPPIDGRMLAALLVSVAAFTSVAAWLWLRRVRMLAPPPVTVGAGLQRSQRPALRRAA